MISVDGDPSSFKASEKGYCEHSACATSVPTSLRSMSNVSNSGTTDEKLAGELPETHSDQENSLTEESLENIAISKLPESLSSCAQVDYAKLKAMFRSNCLVGYEQKTEKAFMNDETFMRFFIARNMNLKKTEKMLRNHIKYRKQNDVDSIERTEFLHIIRSQYLSKVGYGIQGEPVILVDINRFNPKMFESPEQMTRFNFFVFDKIAKEDLSVRKGITKAILIVDLHGFSMHKHWTNHARRLTKEMVTFVQDHNPERLLNVLVVNSPVVFPIIWTILKVFIDPIVRSKIRFVTDYSSLQTYVSSDQIPQKYGGQKPDNVQNSFF